MRVCEFVGNMNGGGVETVVMNYYRHIDRSKVQFDFVVTEGSTIVPREEMEGLGGRVFMVPAYTHLLQFQRANYALFRAHPEWLIVHAHMNALNVFPLASAAKAGVPVSNLTETEASRLLRTEDILHQRVVGQDCGFCGLPLQP